MNRRQLGLGVASATLALGSAARAQQVYMQRSPEATAFYNSFTDQIGRLPQDQQPDVRAFYELNGWRPVWTRERLRDLNAVAARAERHGLSGADQFDFVGLAADPATSDLRTTAAALAYARILAEGKVRPETVEELWEMQKNRVDLPRGLNDALSRGVLLDWYEGLAPTDIGYTNLSAGYVRYSRLANQGGWPAFAAGATIEPGASDRRVPALIDRLTAEGDLSAADGARLKAQGLVYDSELQAAVRSFQTRHGLGADGRVGPATQRSLGASAQDRARQIALNLERRRWLKRDVAPERIEVNTAAAIMVYWKDAKPVHSNRVVVGSHDNQTPSLEKPFASVVANPPWYVPAGIARREILPKGPGYLAANDMYVSNGTVIQRAGPKSALGYVKFELRDSYAIFLHDTPSKAAFNLSMRQRSHGCVRVQGAVEFARLLLSPDPAKLEQFDVAQDSRETTRVTTGREISVRLLYWTAFVDGQGRVAFREDVYDRDAKLAQALGIAVSLPRVVDDGRKDENDVGP
ncbi:MAG: peptidoglycan-binding protein [Brevundimonas sp.]|uniref:L,D-transpeptidase family protein n=1 Tax=Brevundimonas albigilva TaxID=1312364 RepID=A0ABY4SQF3_9CAUL|nr:MULTISPECIES: L,D-transpeptidase family protein [Brevundimonas]MCV0416470.1 L,D-transpeptidase family protein [Brevundimonas sp.]PZU62034.1 MAG: peptidoglycan-binding protein [Brevundimonas sp.]UQV18836.1 L,D-transpeptidase family protein [Brevundimonas albigilva]URI16365.1 L,D-transpeptidase family protein [Brevundimonas albigilva]